MPFFSYSSSTSLNLTETVPLLRYLDTNGDGTGSKNASVNGSSTEVRFFIKPEVGQTFLIYKMFVTISDAGILTTGSYGNTLTPSNGLIVRKTGSGGDPVIYDVLDGLPIKANTDWARIAFDESVVNLAGTKYFYRYRWTAPNVNYPLCLHGDSGEELEVIIRDNLTGLEEHYFQVQGYVI